MRYLDCIFLFYPSVRTLAYLDELITNNCLPKYLVWMGSCDKFVSDEIRAAWHQYRYSDYFNLDIPLDSLRNNVHIQNFSVESTDINAPELSRLLQSISCKELIFTGGGIVKQQTLLTSDKNWLHVHPGGIPEYKGSTCFYYSYLQAEQLGCSAFYLTEQLDRGEVLCQCHFEVNYPLAVNEKYFLDYVLDSYIRKKTLGRFLFAENLENITRATEFNGDSDDYYVIHPLLRKLCADKLVRAYQKFKPKGIFIKN